MSDPDKPREDEQPASPASPKAIPPAPAEPTEASPLEVMPDGTALPADAPQTPPDQTLVVRPPATPSKPPIPSATPIDYAMPAPKTYLPSPALVKNLGCIFKMLFGFTVLLILGYVMLMALNPKAREWALQGNQPNADGSASPSRGPTPFKAMNQVLAIPAQALGKTDDVVQANNARAGLLDGMIAEEENQAKPGAKGSSRPAVNPFATTAPAPGAKSRTGAKAGPAGEPTDEEQRAANAARLMALQEKAAAQRASGEIPEGPTNAVRATAIAPTTETLQPITLPGGIVIRPASPEGTPPPTRAFFYGVANLAISGINPPRLLINGRLVQEGHEIQSALGITLEQIDTGKKLLVFRDKSGALVTRSY